jgi:hypothetical protein
MSNTQKPYWVNEVYLDELKSLLRKMENESWIQLRRNLGKGVGGYDNHSEYLTDIEDLKRMISKVELEINVSNQMDMNNKLFNQSIFK